MNCKSIHIIMSPPRNVTVVVLGDIGRSPRMQYHCLSLANLSSETHVSVVAYGGSTPLETLQSHPRIHQHLISQFPSSFPRRGLFFPIFAACKIIYQIFQLLWCLLFAVARPDFILVQNPPAVPVLLIVQLVSWLRCSRLVIDWHNFGYTILGLSKGQSHWSVRISRWFVILIYLSLASIFALIFAFLVAEAIRYERVFGRGAHANFCVTRAMSDFLRSEWDIEATVLYDRPPAIFRRMNLDEQHALFMRLETEHAAVFAPLHQRWFGAIPAHLTSSSSAFSPVAEEIKPTRAPRTPRASKPTSAGRNFRAASPASPSASIAHEESTLFTTRRSSIGSDHFHFVSHAQSRQNRPALLISSTSWTEDEDFGILLDAIAALDAKKSNQPLLFIITGTNDLFSHLLYGHLCLTAKLLFFVHLSTGKGPQRQMYEQRIAAMKMSRCAVLTLWLAAEDYPRLLGTHLFIHFGCVESNARF
jgi:beta-1,4-mannosyltransferase